MFLYLPFIIQLGDFMDNFLSWPNKNKYFDEIKDEVKILYIDSGCDINHIEVKENILINESKSFVDNDSELYDYTGHGTQIISAITGKHNMIGLYPRSKIVIYKITNYKGETKFEWLYKALYKAIKMDYKIINISYSGYTQNNYIISKFKRLIEQAVKKNIHILCSASNDEVEKGFSIPSDFKGVYKIASINIEDKYSSYISKSNAEYFAPGGDNYLKTQNPQSFILLANSSISNFNIGSDFGIDKRYTLNFGNSIACSYVSCCIGLVVTRRKIKFNKDTSKRYIDCLYNKYKHISLNVIKNTKEIITNEHI
uniref:ElxP n=1 Tax=Staphylococcus epidermidis TaxID=1282 RepID=I6ZUU2_STAEP|nr:ElxP [Staphylococcus epidermidis]